MEDLKEKIVDRIAKTTHRLENQSGMVDIDVAWNSKAILENQLVIMEMMLKSMPVDDNDNA